MTAERRADDASFQQRQLTLHADLYTRLKPSRDARKAIVYAARATREAFDVPAVAVATLRPGRTGVDMVFALPRETEWDLQLFSAYLRGRRPSIPEDTLLAPVKRRGRSWAILALQDRDRGFSADQLEALFVVARIMTEIIGGVDDARLLAVRRRIEKKLADRQEPKDLIYDILHGIRSLTRYDHSAALLIASKVGGALKLVAEQIAWTKAKSKKIGLQLDVRPEQLAELTADEVRLFEKTRTGWILRPGRKRAQLPALLDWDATPARPVPPPVSILAAPIATPQGTLGVLKIASRRRGVLGDYEAQAVAELMPLASLAIQFSVRTETMREQMLQSERKHALANLTRGITHDVNNALGAMLPLVQQLRADARDDRLQAETVEEDLAHVEQSIRTCRRIFGGMLTIARGSSRSVGDGNLRRAIEAALSVLEDSMRRRGIETRVEFPDEFPPIRAGQGDLTQLFLNLCHNACDAMGNQGGKLMISARNEPHAVAVTVEDTGCGIPPENRERVSEPFFTTKTHGNGLGLSICRSILWDVGGKMKLDSEVGRGTRLELTLPVLARAEMGGEP